MVTKKEQNLIELLNKKGYLLIEDFQAEFSVNYWKGMIKKFFAMNLIKESEIVGRYDKINTPGIVIREAGGAPGEVPYKVHFLT